MHTLDFKTLMICTYITQPAVLKYIAYTYCKLFKVKSFVVVELNCNLLESIHCCMAVLSGQTLLHMALS